MALSWTNFFLIKTVDVDERIESRISMLADETALPHMLESWIVLNKVISDKVFIIRKCKVHWHLR